MHNFVLWPDGSGGCRERAMAGRSAWPFDMSPGGGEHPRERERAHAATLATWASISRRRRILKEGFEGPPPSLEPGQTAAFARWSRGRHGAVFFIRRWRNGEFDRDLAITCQDPDGNWLEPASYGGGGWRDPYDRPPAGWDGEPILWMGESSSTVCADDDDEGTVVRVFEGLASPQVSKLEVLDHRGQLFDVVQIRRDTGMAIVGVVGEEPYVVVARAADDSVLRDARGREVRDVFDPPEDFPSEALRRLYGESDDVPHSGFLSLQDDEFYVSSKAGTRKIENRELMEYLKTRLRQAQGWPRRAASPDDPSPGG